MKNSIEINSVKIAKTSKGKVELHVPTSFTGTELVAWRKFNDLAIHEAMQSLEFGRNLRTFNVEAL
jgi:hypothetical protein